MLKIRFFEDFTQFGIGFNMDAEELELSVYFAFWTIEILYFDGESI